MYIMHIAVTNVFLIYCEYILQKMRSKDQKRQTLELQVRLVMLTMLQSQPIYFSRYPNPPDIVLSFCLFFSDYLGDDTRISSDLCVCECVIDHVACSVPPQVHIKASAMDSEVHVGHVSGM